MKGGYVHERLLLDGIEKLFRERGLDVERQVGTTKGKRARYADLMVKIGSQRLIVEAETSSKRIKGDLQKANEVSATWLWIVVPNRKVADSVQKRLRELNVRQKEPWLCVLTLGQAAEQLANCFPLFSRSKVTGEIIHHARGGVIR